MRQPSLRRSIETIASSPRGRWVAVVLVACAILVASVIPIPGSVPDDGGGIPMSVLFHFVGYAALTTALGVALSVHQPPFSAAFRSLVGASLYGVLIECVQHPIPYRSFSYTDMLTNSAGAILGVLLLAVLISRSE